jgi:CDP-paratose 2-epimerase
MKNILITGGAGFIGANAAFYFLKKGWRVIIADNFSRKGARINADWLRKEFPDESLLKIIEADIPCDAFELFKLVTKADVVLHTAAQVAVTTSVTKPFSDFEINCRGTLNILEAVRSAGHKPIVIYTSTNKVYGNLKNVEFSEETSRYVFQNRPYGISEEEPLDFYSPYGCSKGAADQYVHDYCRIYGIPTIVFRQSCIYGPHQFGIVDQGWLAYLTACALFDKPITIYGNGKQVRDVLFVSDLVKGFDLAVENIKATKGEIYNIGGGPKNTVSILELIKFLEDFLKKKITPKFDESRPGDQLVYISDIRKAEKEFGWRPETGFEEGMEKMIIWLKKNKKNLF